MKNLILLFLLLLGAAAGAQTYPSYQNIKLTQLPAGAKADSVVVSNGGTKLLKQVPLSTLLNAVAPKISPTFTGTVTLPALTSIGGISSTEIGYVDGVTSAIQTQLNGKLTSATGTTNYLQKVNGTNSLGNSRILDTGTYLGIGTVTPTKDITFGNQTDREISIEESSNTIGGKALLLRGGRTINYVPETGFNAISVQESWSGIAVSPVTGDVYVARGGCGNSGDIYKQSAGTGTFIGISVSGSNQRWEGLHVTATNDLYGVTYYSGVWKQTNSTGAMVRQQEFNGQINGITSTPNGDVYLCVVGEDIYKQTGGTGAFVAMGQTYRGWVGIASDSSGNVFSIVSGGDVYKLVTGTFVAEGLIARDWSDIFINGGNLYATTNGSKSIYVRSGNVGEFALIGTLGENINGVSASPITNNVYISTGGSACGWGYIYMQNNNTFGTANLSGGSLKLASGTGKGVGDSNVEIYTGQKLASGTDMQGETLRAKIDNEGLMTLPSVTNALITADATGKAVVTKEYVATLGLPAHLEYNDTDKTVWNNGKGNNLYSTSFGDLSLSSNVGGYNNTAIGYSSLSSNIGGFSNTALGYTALKTNGEGWGNVGIGSGALYANTSGVNNTASGSGALASNTSQNGNTATGNSALTTSNGGYYNTADGDHSLYSNIAGNNNTATGAYSMYSNTGGNNTGIGYGTLFSKTTGSDNVAIGMYSGRYIADKSTAVTVLSNSIMIGNTTSPLGDSQTNQIVIGDNATGAGSNTTTIGNASVASTVINGLITAPTTTNALITANVNGKALITKEYLTSVVPAAISILKTYYVDTVNGNDATAQEGNINRPYKTIDPIFAFCGYSEPFTYNNIVLLTNGIYYINSVMAQYGQINFISDKKVTISFENNTNAQLLAFATSGNYYRFNIPYGKIILSDTVDQYFSGDNWEITCDEFYTSYGVNTIFQNTGVFKFKSNKTTLKKNLCNSNANSNYYICPNTVITGTNISIIYSAVSDNLNILTDLRGKVTGTGGMSLATNSGEVYIGDITLTGVLYVGSGHGGTSKLTFYNSKISASSVVLAQDNCGIIQLTGTIDPSSPGMSVSYTIATTIIFKNFTCDFKNIVQLMSDSNYIFDNVNLSCDTVFFSRNTNGKTHKMYGINNFYSRTPTVLSSGTVAATIEDYGSLRTNIPALGTNIAYLKKNTDLMFLSSYADDTAAAAGGIPVGFEYINSTTGALTRRLL